MKQTPFTSKRWRRVEYERLVDVGAFEGEPLELIGGQLIVAEPQHSPHAAVVGMVGDALRASLPPGWVIRVQAPIALDDESAPEPDVGSVYARAGITDYCIVNLVDQVVEVYRNPEPDVTAAFGWRYAAPERVRPPATLTLLELPQSAVRVAALLP
jgi:Uma2 family endonuclease